MKQGRLERVLGWVNRGLYVLVVVAAIFAGLRFPVGSRLVAVLVLGLGAAGTVGIIHLVFHRK